MVSTDLRHPDLRWRDVRHISQSKSGCITWDAGLEPKNEWVYTSVEDEPHKKQLLRWLRGKGVPESSDAFLLWDYENALVTVTWGELLAGPEKFFGEPAFELLSKSLEWRLDHREGCVSRFGRWNVTI